MSLTPESLQGNEWVYAQISQDPILHAFDERKIADPRFDLPKTIIPGDELEWTEVLKNQSSGRQATYVHVPFCLTRCSFCRFFQNFSHDTKVVDTYAHLLAREIQFTAEASENIKPIEAMYFCGGTPTTLSPDNIKLVLNSLRSNLPFRDDAEITFEARLRDLDNEKLNACTDSGVNRFSIGIQSFDTKVRRLMSRSLDREAVLEKLTQMTGNPDLSILVDLIYGLPYQNEEVWESDLVDLMTANTDEVDLYQLDDTFLKLRFDSKFSSLPMADMESRARMYARAVSVLRNSGFTPKNNTHWVRNKKSRNLYTSIIRTGYNVPNNDLISFGSGAIGKAGEHEYKITTNLDDYAQGIHEGRKPVASYEVIGNKYLYELMCQFNSGTVLPDLFTANYGINVRQRFEVLIDSYVEAELIEDTGASLVLTDAGRFWKNNISLAFCIAGKLYNEDK